MFKTTTFLISCSEWRAELLWCCYHNVVLAETLGKHCDTWHMAQVMLSWDIVSAHLQLSSSSLSPSTWNIVSVLIQTRTVNLVLAGEISPIDISYWIFASLVFNLSQKYIPQNYLNDWLLKISLKIEYEFMFYLVEGKLTDSK